ncbi:class I SAM-dependent methyltransferase [Pelagicoccus sp. NFK12]|uniref:Class I SAM-dependent methyltransferase n=1 Tax=Pelagicoccus enzymogenes TaxID=2773457 RepID=A0A927FBQ0_9BACT|nr:class I SAM-dependent methyltransferase [Pelagicoccus enzymogenes]MBD5781459.1 class I SAM-dependent methyltransferase [Pelagicoccus enzymogenes]
MHKIKKSSHNWLAYDAPHNAIAQNISNFVGVVADLGCGKSPYKPDIEKYASQYIGVDWENSLHDQSNVNVFSNLNEEIKLPDNSADTALVMHVMEHLSEPDNFLAEANRILKDDGFILIQVPFNWHLHEEPHDYFRYTPYGLEHLLKKANFDYIETKTEGGIFTVLTLKFNYASRKILRGPLRILGIPIWFINQHLARWLDNKIKYSNEFVAITATARKRAKLF